MSLKEYHKLCHITPPFQRIMRPDEKPHNPRVEYNLGELELIYNPKKGGYEMVGEQVISGGKENNTITVLLL